MSTLSRKKERKPTSPMHSASLLLSWGSLVVRPRARVIDIKDTWYKSLPYCHQYFFGGKYDLIQLHRQIIHQNDGVFMRN